MLMSTSEEIRSNVLQALEERFGIKIMGPATWILSLHVSQTPSGMTLHQTAYITEMLKRY